MDSDEEMPLQLSSPSLELPLWTDQLNAISKFLSYRGFLLMRASSGSLGRDIFGYVQDARISEAVLRVPRAIHLLIRFLRPASFTIPPFLVKGFFFSFTEGSSLSFKLSVFCTFEV